MPTFERDLAAKLVASMWRWIVDPPIGVKNELENDFEAIIQREIDKEFHKPEEQGARER